MAEYTSGDRTDGLSGGTSLRKQEGRQGSEADAWIGGRGGAVRSVDTTLTASVFSFKYRKQGY